MNGACVLVTGASGVEGVGGWSAKLAANAGADVVVNYATHRDGAEAVAQQCRESGREAIVVQADIRDDVDARRLVRAAVDHFGRIDGLVNNAAVGKSVPHADLEALESADFHRIVDTNLIGAFQVTRAAAPYLAETNDGAVVNISSAAGLQGTGSSIAYAASKAGLNTMTMSLARALAPNVRVNAIAPGGMLGGWTQRVFGDAFYEKRKEEVRTRFPLRRAPYPKDVAELAVWLLAHARLMTGEVLRIDGGRHLMVGTS
ncbi:MAG: SDR family oxidoreductase [Dehalococcoidia bacterium]